MGLANDEGQRFAKANTSSRRYQSSAKADTSSKIGRSRNKTERSAEADNIRSKFERPLRKYTPETCQSKAMQAIQKKGQGEPDLQGAPTLDTCVSLEGGITVQSPEGKQVECEPVSIQVNHQRVLVMQAGVRSRWTYIGPGADPNASG